MQIGMQIQMLSGIQIGHPPSLVFRHESILSVVYIIKDSKHAPHLLAARIISSACISLEEHVPTVLSSYAFISSPRGLSQRRCRFFTHMLCCKSSIRSELSEKM